MNSIDVEGNGDNLISGYEAAFAFMYRARQGNLTFDPIILI
jgi:hypothetical protein